MSFDAGTLKGQITLEKSQWDKSIAETQTQLNALGNNAELNEKKLQGLGLAMTAAGVAITAGLATALTTFKNTGDMLDEMAQKTGISTEKLSGLGYVASLSGVSLEGVGTAVKILSGVMYDVAAGNDAAAKKFESLGISALNADGSLKAVDIVIGEVADKFKTMPDGANKTAIAVDLFGRSGQALIPVLNGGKDSIDALTKKAVELGIVYSEQDAKAAAKLDDAQIDLKASVAGLSKEIGTALAPAVTGATGLITDMVKGAKDWVKNNQELASGLVPVIGGIGLFATAAGGVLMILPRLKDGLDLIGLKFKDITTFAGKATLGLGAFFIGWQAGSLIREITGVDKEIQGVIDKTQVALEWFNQVSMAKMGWTENGQQALFLRDSIVEVAKKLDPTVSGLREAARVIKDNTDAYEQLHPRLQRIIDGMTDMTGRVQDAVVVIPTQTQDMADAIQKIVESATEEIKRLSMSEVDFKIWQLNREHQENLAALTKNRATKEQFATLEHAHNLRLQKIRNDAHANRLIVEQKQLEEYTKTKEIEFQEEESRWTEHSNVLTGLYEAQQDLLYKQILQRGNWRNDEAVAIQNWRDAELMKVQDWENAQLTAAYNRLQEQKINFQQYQEEIEGIKKLSTDKQEGIENEARDRQQKADEDRIQNSLLKTAEYIDKAASIYTTFVNGLTAMFDIQHKKHIKELEDWYALELLKIDASKLSNEDRATAINTLNDEMERKKAELDDKQAKREKALAIAAAIANTAVAVTTAIRALPWPFNLPLIAFAVAVGAAQIAAIGGSYNGPGVEDGGGGGTGPGPGPEGGGGGEGGGGPGGGGPGPEMYAEGTGGYITPPRDFIVGEPGSPEYIQMRGDLSKVQMSVTPMGTQALAAEAPPQVTLNFSVNAVDAASFKGKFIKDIAPLIQQAIVAGLITVPRGRIG